MADNKNFIPVSIDMDTLKNSPEIIQVRNAGNFTPEEQVYWDGMSKLANLNYILSTDPDQDSAKNNFAKLDPNIQKALMGLNPEAEYSKSDANVFAKYLFSSKIWLTNPLRSLEKGSKAYIGALENQVLNVLNAGNKLKETIKAPFAGRDAIEKVGDKLEASIEKRLETGKVSKNELTKLIEETKALLKMLESYLDKVN